MSLGKIKKVDAGSGGYRGHSGMDHRNKTEFIKWVTKKKRRAESKRLSQCSKENE
jgi:hypothetical protein